MKCPRHESTLASIEVEGLTLDSCPECRGMWFDRGELREAKDKAAPDLDWLDFEIWKHEDEFRVEARECACPRCSVPMVGLTYGSLAVDIHTCPSCRGTWLDDGQFARLIETLHDEASAKSAKDYLKRSLREGLDIVRRPGDLAAEWSDFKHVLNFMKARLQAERPGLWKVIESAQKSGPF